MIYSTKGLGDRVGAEPVSDAGEKRSEGAAALPAAWPGELDTGVSVLDEQHRLIDRVLVSLHQTLQVWDVPRDLVDRIDQLQCLVEEHFATEEAVMETCAYPHLGPHRAEHEALVERLRELQIRYSRPDAPPLVELVQLVREMLLAHVRYVDLDYAEYLRQAIGFRPIPSR
jgi:hemerythrin-like metal-binding protein